MRTALVFLALATLGACTLAPPASTVPFSAARGLTNVLDTRGVPRDARDLSRFSFSDQGAWFSFGLPAAADSAHLGGFTGPLLLTRQAEWLGRTLVRLDVREATGEPIGWEAAPDSGLSLHPGALHQRLTAGPLIATLDLVFASESSAVIGATVSNTGAETRTLHVGWTGDVWLEGARLLTTPAGAAVALPKSEELVAVAFRAEHVIRVSMDDSGRRYRAEGSPIRLEAGESISRAVLVSLYPDAAARAADASRRDGILARPEPVFEASQARWTGYLDRVLSPSTPAAEAPRLRRVAVKALLTLVANWRSPRGDLRYDGLFPSYADRDFHGIWSWDSWKHARALAYVAPELAKQQLRVMFDYQDRDGMVPDVIYVDAAENNWRDTKPPLSAWAVWAIYRQDGDRAFLEEMYPKLTRYHRWWYAHRDHDGNGLCEYGSTDGTRVAAAWESGMDNAVRFDRAQMVQNGPRAWSFDQESVDLNAYLYAEKHYLAAMADALGRPLEAGAWRAEASSLRTLVQRTMFDEKTGFFHDVTLEDKQPVTVFGPEGWIPLWAGIATEAQAARARRVMLDPAKFATAMPFPTLAADHAGFDPSPRGYWRGPVWIDQAYFAIRGLQRYGFDEDAEVMMRRLFEAAEGLLGDGPIHENYHPHTGAGLNAPHFSWSAAHYLLLLLPGDRADLAPR